MTTRFSAALGAATLALTMTQAGAADFKAGDWDLSVGGNINAFYTHTNCGGAQTITGLALATQALGCGGLDSRTVIGNGLLPNALVTTAKTKQDGVDVGATFMIGAATSSGDAIANNNNVDIRQAFMIFGADGYGNVKAGRDYGYFGRDAILTDMTLFGAGAPVSATQRNRVTLGHIGAGYTYLGTYGQIAYTSPFLAGFSGTFALISPVDSDGNVYVSKSEPQLQATASYTFTGGKAWVGLKSQKFYGPVGDDFTMNGAEIGASVTLGGFGLLANVQSGKGLGILSDGDSGPRRQTNYLVQGTFQAMPKLKLGVNYGVSRLQDGAATDLRSNSDVTGGAYFALTKSLTLTAEVSRTESKSVQGERATLDGVAAGAILFF